MTAKKPSAAVLKRATRRMALLKLPQISIGFRSDEEVKPGEAVTVGVKVACSVILTGLKFSSVCLPVSWHWLALDEEERKERRLVSSGSLLLGESDLDLTGGKIVVMRKADVTPTGRVKRRGDILQLTWWNHTGKPQRLYAVVWAVPYEVVRRREAARLRKAS